MKRFFTVVVVCCMSFYLTAVLAAGSAAEGEKEITFQCWKCKETFKLPASTTTGQCPRCGAKFARKLPAPTPRPESAAISWEDGADYIGKTKTVEGTVAGTHLSSSSGNLYLNFCKDYRTCLSVQIPASEIKRFRSDAESFYQNKKISVKGLIHSEKGFLRIKVMKPEDIKVID